MSRSPLALLHAATIRVQLPIVLVAVPVLAALHGFAIAPIVVDVVVDDAPPELSGDVLAAVRVAVLATVCSVAAATAFAAMLLRGSIRSVVDELVVATRAVAAGDLGHRVGSARRDELGQLACAIDAMAARLERLEQVRRRLLACVSHELRTPLTIIQGQAFTLARSERDPVRLDRLDLVQAEAVRLGQLVADLLDASSMQSGGVRLSLRRRDLVDLAREQVGRFAERAAARGVAIELGGRRHHVEAHVDDARLGQVFANLLENAVRHSPDGGVVRVSVDVERGADPARTIVVENRCAPISREDAARLFEPFVQGEGSRNGSLGLGLAIARAIVEGHGGSVGLDVGAAERGIARVRIDLPAPAGRGAGALAGPRRGFRAAPVATLAGADA